MLVKRLNDLNGAVQEILGLQDKVRHNSHTYTLSFSHSLTHEDDDEDSRKMRFSFAFFYSKETETERAHAGRTTCDSLTRFHRLHLTLAFSRDVVG